MRDNMMFASVALVAVMVLAGCQQPRQETPNQQQARLLAAQNADLQKQLQAKQTELDSVQKMYTQELRKRDQELIRCKVRIEELQQDVKKGIDERVKSVTAAVVSENAKLRQENEQLKAQLQKLKGQPQRDEAPSGTQAAPTKEGQ